MPYHVHAFSPQPRDLSHLAAIADTHGYDTVRRAVGPLAVPGAILLDFCCGLGFMARAAVEFGMRFRGNELNAARLAKTVAKLQAAERVRSR